MTIFIRNGCPYSSNKIKASLLFEIFHTIAGVIVKWRPRNLENASSLDSLLCHESECFEITADSAILFHSYFPGMCTVVEKFRIYWRLYSHNILQISGTKPLEIPTLISCDRNTNNFLINMLWLTESLGRDNLYKHVSRITYYNFER